MRIYGLLDDSTRKLCMYAEDILSDYKADDISLEKAVIEILLISIEYKNEKEKEEANLRRENQANL